MTVYRNTDDAISRLAELKRQYDELKNRQFIGSNQIVMYPQESGNTWDITLVAKNGGQTPTSPGWNVAIITATSIESDNLVADMVPSFSISMPLGGGWIDIPLPANETTKKQWFVPIFADMGASVSIKAQVIANTPVNITAEEVTY